MTTWLFSSTDTGVGNLTGQAGSFIAILDACLVNGVNSSSSGWSATYAAGVITYSKTSHGMPIGAKGVVITITGFSPSGYNKTNTTMTVVDANTITVASADPGSSPATGTATVVRASAGFSKAFSGTNLASYRAGSGNQFYLGVDDTGTTQCRIRAFETMGAAGVAVASGTGPTPTDAQVSGGLYQWKSSTADATARPWFLVTDGKMIHFYESHTAGLGGGFRFGDFYSRLAGDPYNTMIVGDIAASATSTSIRVWNLIASMGATSGCFVIRPFTGIAGSVNLGQVSDVLRTAAVTEMGSGGATYPHPIEGGMVIAPLWISEGTAANGCRGTVPGVWVPCHNRPVSYGDVLSGVGGTSLANKVFLYTTGGSSASQLFEISDTWAAPT